MGLHDQIDLWRCIALSDAGTSRQVERERERKPNVGRAGIAAKLNDDMGQMRSEANSSRETLRALIEAKLDHSAQQQAEAVCLCMNGPRHPARQFGPTLFQ